MTTAQQPKQQGKYSEAEKRRRWNLILDILLREPPPQQPQQAQQPQQEQK